MLFLFRQWHWGRCVFSLWDFPQLSSGLRHSSDDHSNSSSGPSSRSLKKSTAMWININNIIIVMIIIIMISFAGVHSKLPWGRAGSFLSSKPGLSPTASPGQSSWWWWWWCKNELQKTSPCKSYIIPSNNDIFWAGRQTTRGRTASPPPSPDQHSPGGIFVCILSTRGRFKKKSVFFRTLS